MRTIFPSTSATFALALSLALSSASALSGVSSSSAFVTSALTLACSWPLALWTCFVTSWHKTHLPCLKKTGIASFTSSATFATFASATRHQKRRGYLDAPCIQIKHLISAARDKRNSYNRLAAARDLGMHKSTLFRKIKKLGIILPQLDGRSSRGNSPDRTDGID